MSEANKYQYNFTQERLKPSSREEKENDPYLENMFVAYKNIEKNK